ncbi:MAG: hypothetical protein ACKVS9_11265 [Phycisphaerae bacterium]
MGIRLAIRVIAGATLAVGVCHLLGCASRNARTSDRRDSSSHNDQSAAAGPAAAHANTIHAELVSPLGIPLLARDAASFPRLAEQLAAVRQLADQNPRDVDAAIWHGRRLGYLWRMSDAIAVYSNALATHPEEPRLLRHRGHRYLSVRRFDEALADLSLAAERMGDRAGEVEPDGMPNEQNVPLTTLGFNVHYHRALALYLRGDFESALAAWHDCAAHVGPHDDNVVAVRYWTYLTLRRLDHRVGAFLELERVDVRMNMIENHAYHHLLLLFNGLLSVEELTDATAEQRADFPAIGYGVGAWYLASSRRDDARAMFERVIATGDWPAFGYIAAEAELVRLKR